MDALPAHVGLGDLQSPEVGPLHGVGVAVEHHEVGLAARPEDPGVVVDVLGIDGTRGRNHLTWNEALWADNLRRRAPDLYTLSYGTNESVDASLSIPLYAEDLREQLRRFRRALPDASCVLLGPVDFPIVADGWIRPRPVLREIIEAQRQVAAEEGCGFWDGLAFMGGELSMPAWVRSDPPLARKDHLHYTRRGGVRKGMALADALMFGFDAAGDPQGGPTALLVTEGFTDLLRLGRQARPRLYALDPELPPPLVPKELCVPVPERLGPDGAALTPLTDEALAALREQVAALGVASVAVVLLHSYASDRHERAVAEALRPLGLPVSLSSQVLPAPREYERACATVADAYVAPVVAGYLGRLQAVLAGDDGVRLRVNFLSPLLALMSKLMVKSCAALARRRGTFWSTASVRLRRC